MQEQELTAQTYFERGFSAGDPDEKIRFYNEAIRLKPDFWAPYGKRALLWTQKAAFRAAIADFRKYLELPMR